MPFSYSELLSVAPSAAVIAAPYVAYGALGVALIAAIVGWSSHRRMRRLQLRRGESLEDTLGELTRRVKELQVFREELEHYLKGAETRLGTSMRGFGMVRFNPFQGDGSGGNQSFALAFLNERGNGVTLSALYTRAGSTSVYAKPVENGVSPFELTEEERQALQQAKESLRAESVQKK